MSKKHQCICLLLLLHWVFNCVWCGELLHFWAVCPLGTKYGLILNPDMSGCDVFQFTQVFAVLILSERKPYLFNCLSKEMESLWLVQISFPICHQVTLFEKFWVCSQYFVFHEWYLPIISLIYGSVNHLVMRKHLQHFLRVWAYNNPSPWVWLKTLFGIKMTKT